VGYIQNLKPRRVDRAAQERWRWRKGASQPWTGEGGHKTGFPERQAASQARVGVETAGGWCSQGGVTSWLRRLVEDEAAGETGH
jgi:hypothetical protein